MPVIQRDTRRHTYADYLEWSRDYGDEVIDGIAYVREPPSSTWAHQELVVELSYQLRSAQEGGSSRVCVAPLDVRLPRSDEPDDKIETWFSPTFSSYAIVARSTNAECEAPLTGSRRSSHPAPPATIRALKFLSTSVPVSPRSGWYTPRIERWPFTGSKTVDMDAQSIRS
jgi:hypothetical protein